MIRKTLLRINSLNQRQWFIFSLISTTSGVWFSLVLNFWGESLLLLKRNDSGDRSFTIFGLILTLVTVGWSLLSLVAQRYNDYHNHNLGITQEDLGNTETLYETLNISSSSVLESSIVEKIKYIDNIFLGNEEARIPIGKPCMVLQKVVSEILHVSSKLLTSKKYNIKENDLNVDIFYSFPKEDDKKWYRSDNSKHIRGLNTDKLLKFNTTFFEAINSPQKYVFYNDKNVAKEINHYVPDSQDIIISSKIIGSIACYYFEIGNETTYIKFVVAISTYGKKFTNCSDETLKNNISYNLKKNVMGEYEVLIKNILCDYYVAHLYNKKKN